MSHDPTDTDRLLSLLSSVLNARMRLRELRRDAERQHTASQACSTELDAELDRFHLLNKTLIVHADDLELGATGKSAAVIITDGLADTDK